MAKKVEVKPQDSIAEEKSERELLWAEYLENYKKKNPVKFARKEANGEFKSPPPSFKGVKTESKTSTGQVRVQIF